MAVQSVVQDILLHLKTLPEEKVKEVLDFVHFLEAKQNLSGHDPFVLSQFGALKGDWEAPGMELYDKVSVI